MLAPDLVWGFQGRFVLILVSNVPQISDLCNVANIFYGDYAVKESVILMFTSPFGMKWLGPVVHFQKRRSGGETHMAQRREMTLQKVILRKQANLDSATTPDCSKHSNSLHNAKLCGAFWPPINFQIHGWVTQADLPGLCFIMSPVETSETTRNQCSCPVSADSVSCEQDLLTRALWERSKKLFCARQTDWKPEAQWRRTTTMNHGESQPDNFSLLTRLRKKKKLPNLKWNKTASPKQKHTFLMTGNNRGTHNTQEGISKYPHETKHEVNTLMKVLSHPGHGTSDCCPLDNWTEDVSAHQRLLQF